MKKLSAMLLAFSFLAFFAGNELQCREKEYNVEETNEEAAETLLSSESFKKAALQLRKIVNPYNASKTGEYLSDISQSKLDQGWKKVFISFILECEHLDKLMKGIKCSNIGECFKEIEKWECSVKEKTILMKDLLDRQFQKELFLEMDMR